MKLVATRETYNGAQQQTMSLMKKMAEQPDNAANDKGSRSGYLFLMEKNTLSARLDS